VALAAARAAGVSELRTTRRLERAAALNRRESNNTTWSVCPGLSAANTPVSHSIVSVSRWRRFPVPGLFRQLREQVVEPPRCDGQELPVDVDARDRLGNSKRHDLRIGHGSFGVLGLLGQEIVSGDEHRSEQQVEVGEHRGPLGWR
jgi:hypothetical protein